MIGDRYKVVFTHSIELVDSSKSGSERYDAKLNPGEYIATLVKNPSRVTGDSNWLMFDGTTLGATHEYIRTLAASITTLS